MQRKEITYKSPFNRKQAFYSSLSLSLVINSILILCIIYMSFRTNTSSPIKAGEIIQYFIILFVSNFILAFILYRLNYRIIKRKTNTKKVILYLILNTLITCTIASPVLSQMQWFLLNGFQYNNLFEGFMAFNLVKDSIMGVILLLEIGIRYSNYQREKTILTNQKLIEENIKTRYEALKNQLDPHFLFNSLNTLNGLIGIDDEKAHDFVDNLSSIFRYTLHSKTICKLSEEIEFANSYINLLKIRYGENLVTRYEIDEKYREWYLMPISIQLLIENAIKHNNISNKKPLFILIQTTEHDSIIVENIINPKINNNLSSGVGLSNLADRYSILFRKSITITNNEGVFSVEIPLISVNDKIIV